jgi:hypothetical protein
VSGSIDNSIRVWISTKNVLVNIKILNIEIF